MGGGYDDGDDERVVGRAERVTRVGWWVIAGVVGLFGVAVVGVIVVFVVLAIAVGQG